MTFVLDASATLAVILAEAGAEMVLENMADAHLSTVNMSETMTKLIEYGMTLEQACRQIDRLELNVHVFDAELASSVAILRQPTKQLGLSLGDRACLALGQSLNLPILTSDRRMAEAKDIVGIDIRMIR